MMPSGGPIYQPHQQGQVQGRRLIRITLLIWIKILAASWLTAFNHFYVPFKRGPLLVRGSLSSAEHCWLLRESRCACCCCISVWAGLTDLVNTGQIFIHIRITYRRKKAFLLLCSSPWSSRPHTHMCRRPPAGNMGFPRRRWLSSCPLSWGRAHHPLSSSVWMVLGYENRHISTAHFNYCEGLHDHMKILIYFLFYLLNFVSLCNAFVNLCTLGTQKI